jgi:hypothetical protein
LLIAINESEQVATTFACPDPNPMNHSGVKSANLPEAGEIPTGSCLSVRKHDRSKDGAVDRTEQQVLSSIHRVLRVRL